MSKYKNILLLYKNSTYAGYFLTNRRRFHQLRGLFNSRELKRFRQTHENHFWALAFVEAVLKHHGLKFSKLRRGTDIDFKRFDLVITVGGDGTFLEAARHLDGQVIWGVNSDPSWSVGRYCSGNPKNFESMLLKIIKHGFPLRRFTRLTFDADFIHRPIQVLNDVLMCHQNPAAISRYYLMIGRKKEEQRSSGVWISTPTGSSGGIHSAGGKVLPTEARLMQYKPRELYRGKAVSGYQLTGGVLSSHQSIELTSVMREGVIFVDGSHVKLPFSFGAKVRVRISPKPLKVIF